LARLTAKYFSFYVTDREIIKFLESFKEKKTNRNRFIIDLLRVASRFQEEMAKAVGMVESQPLSHAKLRGPERLDQNQLIQAIDESLQNWKERKLERP